MPDGGADATKPATGGTDVAAQRELVLVGKPGCHLCDEARPTVVAIAAEAGLGYRELSIAVDPQLADAYFELIPVVLFDGRVVAHWWVDPIELRAAVGAGTHPE